MSNFFSRIFGNNAESNAQVEALEAQVSELTSELDEALNQEPEQVEVPVEVPVPQDMVTATVINVQVNSKTNAFTVDDFDSTVAGLTVRTFVEQMFEGTSSAVNFDHFKVLNLNLSSGETLKLGLDDTIPTTKVIAEEHGGATVTTVVGSQTSGSGAAQ
jgi:hypothetical protein